MFADDGKYAKSISVTLNYVLASVPLRLAFALGVAMLLNKAIAGIGLYRSAYYLPSLIDGSVAVSILWSQVFGDQGLVNSALGLIGIESSTSWIGNPGTALWTLIALSVWQFGSSMLIFPAGLNNIPKHGDLAQTMESLLLSSVHPGSHYRGRHGDRSVRVHGGHAERRRLQRRAGHAYPRLGPRTDAGVPRGRSERSEQSVLE